jgi:hypothetical protein
MSVVDVLIEVGGIDIFIVTSTIYLKRFNWYDSKNKEKNSYPYESLPSIVVDVLVGMVWNSRKNIVVVRYQLFSVIVPVVSSCLSSWKRFGIDDTFWKSLINDKIEGPG